MIGRDKKGKFIKGHKSFRHKRIIEKKCLCCGRLFHAGRDRIKYCSRKCYWKELKNISMGSKNNFWRGGLSFSDYGYTKEFNCKLKDKIRKRDNYQCLDCGVKQDNLRTKNDRKYKLIIHHIDHDKKNNRLNNLMSLCRACHGRRHCKI